MIGIYIPLPEPHVIGRSARSVICHRCWSLHADISLLYENAAIGWSCANPEERSIYTTFFRQCVPDAVLASNHLPEAVREWFDSSPCDLTREESAALLLYRMGPVPRDTIKWLNVRPRPAPLGEPGERIDCEVECTAVTQLPASDWGDRFRIEFACDGRVLHWITGVGGLDAQPGGRYRVRLTIKSHERWAGKPMTLVSRVAERTDE